MSSHRPLALCYIIDSVVASGGAEQALASMAPHFVTAGVRLDVIALSERPGLQQQLRDAGARLQTITATGPGAVRTLRDALNEIRPDLVHTTLARANALGRMAARLAGCPVVTSLVNVSYGPEYRTDPNLQAWKVRTWHSWDAATARLVRRYHALTPHVADVMARRLAIPRARIEVIPRGRDPRLLGERSATRTARVRGDLGLSGDELLLLAAARHERQKGLDVLIEAMPAILSAVPSTRLVIAGRWGNQTDDLRARIARLGLTQRVWLLGSRSDAADLISAADAIVVPSRWEGLGSVLIEAMALQAPIVASDIPPIRQTTGEHCAVLVPPADPGALGAGIVATLTDQRDTAARVASGRARFGERYVLEAVCQQMLAFYDRALGGA